MTDRRWPIGIRFPRLVSPRGSMRKILVTSSLIALLGLAVYARVPAPTAPAKGYGNADAITQDELKVYDYFLASDQLEGRNLPSRGYDTAALYVASHLAEWGLKPGGSQTGTNGPLQPYFMPIELAATSINAGEMKAALTAPAAGFGGRGGNRGGGGGAGARGGANAAPAPPTTTDYAYGKDWTIAAGGGRGGGAVTGGDIDAQLVFAGHGYVIPKSNVNPYQGL
ncbi:MAG TPA: hypothetical protein VFI22_09330, partial [Thermomicrobiales bacterium]|nr:hypothetical protein [Thermomicrobiales bacterium]